MIFIASAKACMARFYLVEVVTERLAITALSYTANRVGDALTFHSLLTIFFFGAE